MARPRKHELRKVFEGLELFLWTVAGDRRPEFRLYAPQRDRLVIAQAISQMIADFGHGTRRFVASTVDDYTLPYGRKPSGLRVVRLAELVVKASQEPLEPEDDGRVLRESSTITITTDAEGAQEIARRLEAADEVHGNHLVGGDDDGLYYSPDWRGIE